MRRNIWVVLIVVVLAGLAVFQNFSKANKEVELPKEQAPKVHFLTPAFSLEGLDGKTYEVGGTRGKALLINFWASWCGPCEDEAPDLVELHEKYSDRLDIYAVNSTKYDSLTGAKKFVEQYKFKFPVLLDVENDATEKYEVRGFPTTFFVDANGVIKEVFPRMLLPNDLKRIEDLLES